jgi:anti-anti-sigma regulatory factor
MPDQRARFEACVEQLYLLATTYSALGLTEKPAICDTLLSVTASFMERALGAMFLQESAQLSPVAMRGDPGEAALLIAAPMWDRFAGERITQIVAAADLEAPLRGMPAFAGGIAVAPLTQQDHVTGLLVIAARAGEEPFSSLDEPFLTAAASIGALSLASAEAISVQQLLTADMNRTATEARREAAEKARLLEELDRQLAVIQRQHDEIRALSTPTLEVWKGVLLLPIIGHVDVARGEEMMAKLLPEVVAKRATHVILDLTGADIADAGAADQIVRLAAASRLLGAQAILTGIQPAVSKTIVSLGIQLSGVRTVRTPEQALRLCMAS